MHIDIILDTRASADELAALGQLAEARGIDGVWVSSLNDSRDPWANLALLARATSTLRLGPIAVNPFDTHPLRIAAGLLTLNELAGGRARVVIGGGGEALQALGLEPRRRVRAVRECVEILGAARSGETVDYAGQLYQVRHCRFGWARATPPAVYIGAGQPQMLRMAAACGDGIMMSDVPPGPAALALATLDEALDRTGRARPAFWTSAFIAWHVDEDAAAARREARRWLYLRGIFRPWLLADFLAPEDIACVMAAREAFARAFFAGSPDVEGVPDRVLDTLVDHLTLCGTPRDLERLAGKLGRLRDAGLGGVALRLYGEPARALPLIARCRTGL